MSQIQVVLSEAQTVCQAASQLADNQQPDEISVSPRGDAPPHPSQVAHQSQGLGKVPC